MGDGGGLGVGVCVGIGVGVRVGVGVATGSIRTCTEGGVSARVNPGGTLTLGTMV